MGEPAMLVAMSVVAGLGLGGCAVGTNYRKPAITFEGFHTAAAVQARITGTSAPALNTDQAAVQSSRAIGGGWGS